MNDYEQRKQDRIDRYLEKAGKARAESSALSQQAHTILSAIPPGQPMLPDHYSYKSDKRYRDRIDTKMRQSISADEKADYYEGKARAAANNRAISSDDPDAAQKLQEKLAALEKSQARMKTINAYYRKHQTCRGCEGVTEEEATRLDKRMLDGYSWETAPYSSYVLSNNNQEIHRIKKRLETLTQNREVGFQGWEFEGGKVVANSDNNRLQVFFDAIPPAEVREALKGHGFRWARSEGAWQRQLSGNAIYAARHIAAIPHCLRLTASAVRPFILVFINMICRRFWTVQMRSLCLQNRQKICSMARY